MDVNGTRYHLLLGASDWGACIDVHPQPGVFKPKGAKQRAAKAIWDAERQEVTFAKRLFDFVASKNDRAPELKDRRGAARDRFGNWYWIAESGGELLVNSAGTSRTSHFWSAADDKSSQPDESAGAFRALGVEQPPPATRFGGLAVTEEHFLVVGVVEPAGLLLFDLHAGGPPRQLCWPAAGAGFVPFDMSPAPGGGVLVLDRENRRFWTFDRQLNVVRMKPAPTGAAADDFQPLEGGEVRRTSVCASPASVSVDDATHVAEGDPVAVEAMPDGTALVLFNARDAKARFSEIRRYRAGTRLGKTLSTEGAKAWIEGGAQSFRLVGHDFAYVPAGETRTDGSIGTLYVVATSGNQSFAFDVYPDGDNLILLARPDYMPMRLFGGKALAAAGAEVFYDFNDRFIPLVIQKRPRYEFDAFIYTPIARAGADESEARVRGAFDGREPDCVWHRLLIDACIPPETSVEISSRAADDEATLALAGWEVEPRLHLRGDGSELPFVNNNTDAARGTGTWELLFQKARGRYLQLRIRLTGNGRATPRLRALRAYYPRFSYLSNYLPAVYREDAESASFLDRFLANFEGFYTTIEDRVAAAQALFDSVAAPREALDWLAGWFGVALDPAWDDSRRRLFIRHAMQFFQWRGTARGLETALQLALGTCADDSLFETRARKAGTRTSGIRIVEKFRTRTAPGVVFGDPTDTGAGGSTRWLKAEGASSVGGATAQASTFTRVSSGCRCGQSASSPKGAGATDTAATLAEGAEVSAAERARWQGYLRVRYEVNIASLNAAYELSGALAWEKFDDVPLPSDLPQQSKARADWLEWVETVAPSAAAVERRMWQDFLAHRYGNVNALNVAYGTRWPRFGVVSLPDATPPAAAAADWQQFVGITLRMRRSAHAFTVMLPITKTFYTDLAHHRERRALAERIINLEKPAHTVFDVKFYWAMFSVGGARLGDDLPLDRGSRAAQLMPPMTLGQQFLAESYLAPSHPQDVSGRQVVGRDALRRRDAQTGRMTPLR